MMLDKRMSKSCSYANFIVRHFKVLLLNIIGYAMQLGAEWRAEMANEYRIPHRQKFS